MLVKYFKGSDVGLPSKCKSKATNSQQNNTKQSGKSNCNKDVLSKTECTEILFVDCFCQIDFIAQHSCLKGADVAPRDVKARHKTAKSTTSFIQQSLVQCKVQHNGLSILSATINHVQFPVSSFTTPKWSVTESRMQPFDQINSLVGGEIAITYHMPIPDSETTRSNWSIKHPHVRAHMYEVHAAPNCACATSPEHCTQFLCTPHIGIPRS